MSRLFKKGSSEWSLMAEWWGWLQKYWDDGGDYEKCDHALQDGVKIWTKYKDTALEPFAKDLIRVGLNQIDHNSPKSPGNGA